MHSWISVSVLEALSFFLMVRALGPVLLPETKIRLVVRCKHWQTYKPLHSEFVNVSAAYSFVTFTFVCDLSK